MKPCANPDHYPHAYFISGKHWWCDACENVIVHTGDVVPLNLTTKLDIFESRQNAWFFIPARTLVAGQFVHPKKSELGDDFPQGDLAAITLVSSYFEGMQHFRKGHPADFKKPKHPPGARGGSGDEFKEGLARVLGRLESDPMIDTFYKFVRNGFFHAGMAYGPVKFDRATGGPPLRPGRDPGHILVDTHGLLAAVEADFATYLAELRAGVRVFEWERCWDQYWDRT